MLWKHPFYSPPLETKPLFSVPIVFTFCRMFSKLNHVVYSLQISLPSLSIRHLKFMHVVDSIVSSFFFCHWVVHWIVVLHFVNSPIEEHLGCEEYLELNMTKYPFIMPNQCGFLFVFVYFGVFCFGLFILVQLIRSGSEFYLLQAIIVWSLICLLLCNYI